MALALGNTMYGEGEKSLDQIFSKLLNHIFRGCQAIPILGCQSVESTVRFYIFIDNFSARTLCYFIRLPVHFPNNHTLLT